MFLAAKKESDKIVKDSFYIEQKDGLGGGGGEGRRSPPRKGSPAGRVRAVSSAPGLGRGAVMGDSASVSSSIATGNSFVRFSVDDNDVVDTHSIFNTPVDPAANWNLDCVRMKKLKKIITYHDDKKRKNKGNFLGKSRKEIRNIEIENMIAANKGQYIQDRLRNLGVTLVYRCAIIGDEMGLRNELVTGRHGVNMRSGSTGRNVLHEAVACGHFAIVKMLLGEFKADPHIRTLLGSSTSLHLAVENNYRQIASILITHGADVNATDARGCAVLHRVKSEPLLRLLMRYDVNFSVKSHEGLTPSEHYIKYMKECDIDNYIPEFGIKIGECEIEAYLRTKKQEEMERKELALKQKTEFYKYGLKREDPPKNDIMNPKKPPPKWAPKM